MAKAPKLRGPEPALSAVGGGAWRRQVSQDRPTASVRGYDARWDRAAKQFRAVNPVCRGCLAAGVVRSAQVVDHVIPHRGNMVLFWDSSMWQAVCAWHHDVVKRRLEFMFEAGEIEATELWIDSRTALAVAAREGGRN